ncbi:MAG: VapC toxin family PIN domain ribonuclease [Thermoprotei archaeon]|nr:MAG: VapC toxin family PIN domain ribonuclease [Thermoprotei archaeon]
MVYLDANVFLYPLLYDPEVEPKAERASRLLLRVASGELRAVTSALTWDEVVWVVWRLVERDYALRAGEKLLTFPNLVIVAVSPRSVRRAQALASRYGLKPRDAIHAAVAIEHGDSRIVSDDEDFDRVRELERVPI